MPTDEESRSPGALRSSISAAMIVGSGWVGRQIAARIAQSGLHVILMDRNPDVVQQAYAWLQRIAERSQTSDFVGSPKDAESVRPDSAHQDGSRTEAVGDSAADWMRLIELSPGLRELQHDTSLADQLSPDLIIECVPEQLSMKRRILKDLSELFPGPAIIVSNSSYFVPSLLQPYVTGPERYAHLHFHVPVLNDSVADVVGGPRTDPQVIDHLESFVRQINLEPLRLRREHPGYVFNWMLQALLKSAMQLVALDVVDPEDVDKSWKSVTGMPLGPFGIMDQIGLDVIEQVLANSRWADEPELDPGRLLELIQEKTREGHLGTKTKQGFYRYDQDMPLMREQ